jgi:hypothetical protein
MLKIGVLKGCLQSRGRAERLGTQNTYDNRKSHEDRASPLPLRTPSMSERQPDEQLKLAYDLFKHLTTLNTGSVLLLLTFFERFSKEPEWRFLIGTSLFLFLVSLVSSLLAMYLLMGVSHDEDGFQIAHAIGWRVYLTAVAGFFLALAAMGLFALKNFY